jgi:UDP-N-acetyl-D-mannosaminuronate dehydrogenase
MPENVVARIEKEVGSLSGVDVAVLGAAYRGGVKETAFSGVFATTAALIARAANVTVHDPLYSDSELNDLGFKPFRRGDPADIAIIQADHDEYAHWTSEDIRGVKVIMDGRGISESRKWGSEVTYLAVGNPAPNSKGQE